MKVSAIKVYMTDFLLFARQNLHNVDKYSEKNV